MTQIEEIKKDKDLVEQQINRLIYEFQNRHKVNVLSTSFFYVGHQKSIKLHVEL